VLVASIVVLVQGIIEIRGTSDLLCFWAVLAGAVSTLTCVVVLLFVGPCSLDGSLAGRIQENIGLISLCLALLWVAGAGVMTFKGPFASP
ncbi:unnamed protein product, partial [Polarella glacialis]